jgi:hypothetical protein
MRAAVAAELRQAGQLQIAIHNARHSFVLEIERRLAMLALSARLTVTCEDVLRSRATGTETITKIWGGERGDESADNALTPRDPSVVGSHRLGG